MKYNFDIVHNRKNTNSVKWDLLKRLFGREDIISMWVADMDFPAAEPVTEALRKRIEHPFYGYTKAGDEVVDAVIKRIHKKFKWKIRPEWIIFTPGVVPALHTAIRSLTHPGDEIILQQPVYYPFFPSVTLSGCTIRNNELKLTDYQYEMDFTDLKNQFLPKKGINSKPNRVKAAVLCNPHNPVGRVWSRNELIRFGEIILKNNAVVISDEIHCELLYRGYKHTPFASISSEFEQNCIVCMAPSKTFNLAGLEISTIIIPNKEIRDEFNYIREGIQPGPNLFAYTALEAAYNDGDEWLEQLLEYLQENLNFIKNYIKKNIPLIKMIEPQGTYLIWLDFRSLQFNNQNLSSFLTGKAGLGLDDGFLFGESGSGFARMNIACPMAVLKESLTRMKKAVDELNHNPG
ncbi:MAG: pyridoxal phosphate-dependent aminotransferase [Spirochaetes bacterium]|nr:pyridoxal phosphate-dependent aminotransferase [Spirochaetota bacterium]